MRRGGVVISVVMTGGLKNRLTRPAQGYINAATVRRWHACTRAYAWCRLPERSLAHGAAAEEGAHLARPVHTRRPRVDSGVRGIERCGRCSCGQERPCLLR